MKRLIPLLLALMLMGTMSFSVLATEPASGTDSSPSYEDPYDDDPQESVDNGDEPGDGSGEDIEQYYNSKNGKSSTTSQTTTTTTEEKENPKATAKTIGVKTGDQTKVLPIIVVVLAAGGIAIYSGRKLLKK